MPTYENDTDRSNQTAGLEALSRQWKTTFIETPTNATVDAMLYTNGMLRALVEYRRIKHQGRHLIFSEIKRIKMLALAEMFQVPAIFLFERDNGYYWFDVSHQPDSTVWFERDVVKAGQYPEWVVKFHFTNKCISCLQ